MNEDINCQPSHRHRNGVGSYILLGLATHTH